MAALGNPLQGLLRPDGTPYRFLLVDDCDTILYLVQTAVEAFGGEVVATARDGMRGLELYRRYDPDLVICDIILPGLSGIEVLKAILRVNPLARVILCSADGHSEMVRIALDQGASYFLVKPFLARDLIKAIRLVLAKGIDPVPGQ